MPKFSTRDMCESIANLASGWRFPPATGALVLQP
jgi:hypothetical protein